MKVCIATFSKVCFRSAKRRRLERAAKLAQAKGRNLDTIQTWALALSERVGHNKAAVALANKTARRLWAAEHHRKPFDPNHVSARPTPTMNPRTLPALPHFNLMAQRVGPRSHQADNNAGDSSPIERMARLRGFHDGPSELAHLKAE